MFVFNYNDDTELASDGNRAREKFFNLFGPRSGRDVIIVRLAPE